VEIMDFIPAGSTAFAGVFHRFSSRKAKSRTRIIGCGLGVLPANFEQKQLSMAI